MRLHVTLLSALATLLLSTGCMSLSADIDELTKTFEGEALTYAIGGAPAGDVTISRQLEWEFDSTFLSWLTDVRLLGGSVTPDQGISDLAFVKAVKVGIVDSGVLPPVELGEYRRGATAAGTDGSVALDVQTEADLTEYLATVQAPVSLELVFSPPQGVSSFSLLADLKLQISLAYDVI